MLPFILHLISKDQVVKSKMKLVLVSEGFAIIILFCFKCLNICTISFPFHACVILEPNRHTALAINCYLNQHCSVRAQCWPSREMCLKIRWICQADLLSVHMAIKHCVVVTVQTRCVREWRTSFDLKGENIDERTKLFWKHIMLGCFNPTLGQILTEFA